MKFDLGTLMHSAGVHQRMTDDYEFHNFVVKSLGYYVGCEWGDTCTEDAALNEEAIINGDRIFAAYVHKDGTKIWIITEADRSYTTILFPSEY